MANETKSRVLSEILKYEAPNRYSRETKTLSTNQTISLGEVLEDDGSNVKAGAVAGNIKYIAAEAVTTTSATADIAVIARNAIVDKSLLTYNSLTEATVDAALEAVGILPRVDVADGL